MGIDVIGADADDGGLLCGVLVLIALEVVGFDSAALSHVFRVEVNDHPLAFEILQADGFAFLGFEGEVGGFGAFGREVGGGGGSGQGDGTDGCEEQVSHEFKIVQLTCSMPL